MNLNLNRYNLLKEDNSRQEHEYKERIYSSNKQYSDLLIEYENIQQSYNDK